MRIQTNTVHSVVIGSPALQPLTHTYTVEITISEGKAILYYSLFTDFFFPCSITSLWTKIGSLSFSNLKDFIVIPPTFLQCLFPFCMFLCVYKFGFLYFLPNPQSSEIVFDIQTHPNSNAYFLPHSFWWTAQTHKTSSTTLPLFVPFMKKHVEYLSHLFLPLMDVGMGGGDSPQPWTRTHSLARTAALHMSHQAAWRT